MVGGIGGSSVCNCLDCGGRRKILDKCAKGKKKRDNGTN